MFKIFCFLPIVLLLMIHFGENLAVPSVNLQSQRGIIFPDSDQIKECFVDELQQVKGICKTLRECPWALQRWKETNHLPKTCYFIKSELIVCCEKNETMSSKLVAHNPTLKPKLVQRRSEEACEIFNGAKTSVVNGTPTKPREFPFMAALGWYSNFNNLTIYGCGGALISNKFILTVAHCVDIGGKAPDVVRLGGVNLTDSTVKDIPIKRIIVHPAYNITSSYNDIALVELQTEVRETPACVWSENDVEHNNVTAIGYGHTRFGGIPSDQLLKASLLLVPNDICRDYYAPNADLLQQGLSTTHICAGDPEKLRDTCQGDSGGPILMKVNRFYVKATYVVGVTSFGRGCAGGPPSIFTRISSYIDWIEDIVWPKKN